MVDVEIFIQSKIDYESYLYSKNVVERNFNSLVNMDYDFRELVIKTILYKLNLYSKKEIKDMYNWICIPMKNYIIDKYMDRLNYIDKYHLLNIYESKEYFKDILERNNIELWEL